MVIVLSVVIVVLGGLLYREHRQVRWLRTQIAVQVAPEVLVIREPVPVPAPPAVPPVPPFPEPLLKAAAQHGVTPERLRDMMLEALGIAPTSP